MFYSSGGLGGGVEGDHHLRAVDRVVDAAAMSAESVGFPAQLAADGPEQLRVPGDLRRAETAHSLAQRLNRFSQVEPVDVARLVIDVGDSLNGCVVDVERRLTGGQVLMHQRVKQQHPGW